MISKIAKNRFFSEFWEIFFFLKNLDFWTSNFENATYN